MIKINLLPHKVEKLKKGLGKEEYIYFGIGVLVLVLVIGSYLTLSFLDSSKKKEIEELKREQARLAVVFKEIKELERIKKDADDKINTVQRLDKGRKDLITILDELNSALPQKVWLVNLRQESDRFFIEGYASDSNLVSMFMKNMETTGKFQRVDLSGVSQEDISKIRVQRFSISTNWKIPEQSVKTVSQPSPQGQPAPQPSPQGKK